MAAPDYSDDIMVALLVPETVGERLALPDGLTADDLHITLAYLGTVPPAGDDPGQLLTLLTAVRDGSAGHKPVVGRYSGVARFTGDPDALVLTYDSPGLAGLRADIVEALEAAGIEISTDHGFIPHTTLMYLPPKQDSPLHRVDPVEIGFDRVHLVYGETAIGLPLAGASSAQDDRPTAGSLNAYPSTTSPTVNAQTKDATFEQLHPRAGGKFATKPKPAGEQDPSELPPDWLDRVLKSDPRYVKAKKGGGGKGKKGGKKGSDAAARAARRRMAKTQRDHELVSEMDRRDLFEAGIVRAEEAEQHRRDEAKAQIDAEKDSGRKAELTKHELETRRRYELAKRKVQTSERARRRAFEQGRRKRQLAQDATEAQTSTAQAAERKAG